MSTIDVNVRGGGTLQSVEINLNDAQVVKTDLLFAMQNQRSRILERTERGVDFEERPFADYNSTRPFYWYPSGRVGKTRGSDLLRREKNNVKRAARKLGGKVSRSGLGVRFESYKAFKLQGLGRSGVDLRGPRAPHMLQRIELKATSGTNGAIGIYDPDAAKRAAGISGEDRPKGMPQRKFFAASDADNKKFAGDLESRVADRARKAMAGQR